MSIIVKTQAELDAAIAAGSQGIIIDSPALVWIAAEFDSSSPAPLSPSGAVECEPRPGDARPPAGPSSPERAA